MQDLMSKIVEYLLTVQVIYQDLSSIIYVSVGKMQRMRDGGK